MPKHEIPASKVTPNEPSRPRSLSFFYRSSTPSALFLFLLAIYLLTYTPHVNSSDGLAMFSTAESLVRHGRLDIEQIRWMNLQQGTYGLDGLLYSRKGIGVPIGLLPLTWLGINAPWFGPVGASLLFNALVTSLTAVLLLLYLQRLGYRQFVGLTVALLFGLATLAWPYAKSLFSDPFSGFLLLAAAYSLLKFSQEATRSRPLGPQTNSEFSIGYYGYSFLAGLLLGWNVATRYAETLFLPLYGLLLLYYLSRGSAGYWPKPGLLVSLRIWGPILAFITPIFLIGIVLLGFNLSRYGDPFNTGYLPNETFSGVLWDGILGQLVSPGRGLWLYSPVLILSLIGFFPFFRRFRAEALLAVSIIIIHLLLYGKWFMWHGGFAWGPRFMVPTLPFWALLLAPIIDYAFPAKTQAGQINETRAAAGYRIALSLKIVLLLLVAIGLIPQFLTLTADFSPYQSSLLDTGLPLFDRQTFFQLQLSPLNIAWAFIKLNTLDTAWAWQGNFNWLLLAGLVVNIVVTGLYLIRVSLRPRETPISCRAAGLQFLPYLSTLSVLGLLLIHTHTLPPAPLQRAFDVLNESVRPSDAIVTNDPENSLFYAELFKGYTPVLGLNHGGEPLPADVADRLFQTISNQEQIWWLPNWLPPEESSVEQILLAEGFRTRNDVFDEQRLLLFATPFNLVVQDLNQETRFDDRINVVKIGYSPIQAAGTALPVELHWRVTDQLTENYHIFVHLVNPEGKTVAQADGQPVYWTRPTSGWTTEETIVDRHGLWIPPDTASGSYRLRIGLYLPADGQRLRLPNGDDAVSLDIQID